MMASSAKEVVMATEATVATTTTETIDVMMNIALGTGATHITVAALKGITTRRKAAIIHEEMSPTRRDLTTLRGPWQRTSSARLTDPSTNMAAVVPSRSPS
jgi:hypothetical protein